MTLDRSASEWRGEDFADLAKFVRTFMAGGHPVTEIAESVCNHCEGRAFAVAVDDEGCAQRVCLACGTAAFIGDSAEHWEAANPGECEWPRGSG